MSCSKWRRWSHWWQQWRTVSGTPFGREREVRHAACGVDREGARRRAGYEAPVLHPQPCAQPLAPIRAKSKASSERVGVVKASGIGRPCASALAASKPALIASLAPAVFDRSCRRRGPTGEVSVASRPSGKTMLS